MTFINDTMRKQWDFILEIQRFEPRLCFDEYVALHHLHAALSQLHTVCEGECNGTIGNNETGKSPQRARATARIINGMTELDSASVINITGRSWRYETQGDPRGLVLRLFCKQTLQSGIIEHEVYVGEF